MRGVLGACELVQLQRAPGESKGELNPFRGRIDPRERLLDKPMQSSPVDPVWLMRGMSKEAGLVMFLDFRDVEMECSGNETFSGKTEVRSGFSVDVLNGLIKFESRDD